MKTALRDDPIAKKLKTDDPEVHAPDQLSRRPNPPKKEDTILAELPPREKWNKYFPWTTEVKGRASIVNPDAARKLAEAYVPEGSKDQVIIEAFPGALYISAFRQFAEHCVIRRTWVAHSRAAQPT
jgi:transcription factor 1